MKSQEARTAGTGPLSSAAKRLLLSARSYTDYSVDPRSPTYYRWLCIIAIPVMYNLLMLAPRAVFSELQADYRTVWLVLDYISDFLYAADIVLRAKTGYLDSGLLVTDCKRLAVRYVRSAQFAVDLASVLPTDLLYAVFGVDFAALRFNRMLKAGRLGELVARTTAAVRAPNLARVCVLVLKLFVIVHWNGCAYYAVSGWIGYGRDSWVYPAADGHWTPLRRKYLYCLYWAAVTLTNVGEPYEAATDLECVLSVVNYVAGVFVFANVVGSVVGALQGAGRRRAELRRTADAAKRYMKRRLLLGSRSGAGGEQLARRVVRWFAYVDSTGRSLGDERLLDALPARLRADVASCVHGGALERARLFAGCERSLLDALALRLRLQAYSPGDYVCRRGDVGREMYIVKSGSLAVVSDDGGGRTMATLSRGAVFGEVSILDVPGSRAGNRRTASVRSVGYADLYVLSKADLWDVLADYPEARRSLVERGREMLRKDRLLVDDDEPSPRAPPSPAPLSSRRPAQSLAAAAPPPAQQQSMQPLEERVRRLSETIEALCARLARLIDDYERQQSKLKKRLQRLEGARRRSLAEH